MDVAHTHVPALVVNDLHVVGTASVVSIVGDGSPKVTPSFVWSYQQRSHNSTLLFHQQFQSILIVEESLRIYGEVAGTFDRQTVIPEKRKITLT